MQKKLAVVMDAINAIHIHKDSTFAILLEAKARGYALYYMEIADLYILNSQAKAHAKLLNVQDDSQAWYEFLGEQEVNLADMDLVLMRKDPPVDEAYLYATMVLELAEKCGALIVNRPQSLRDYNEKLFVNYFPELTPASVMTQSIADLLNFLHLHKDIVCKPLNAMGGKSIFRVRENDVNSKVIFETLTQGFMLAQKYIPEIVAGDKRILLIDGEPISHTLVRIPQAQDWRGNLAAGAKGEIRPLTEKDRTICATLAPHLRAKGLFFVGIDVIGDYLTEINITSPTCMRELDASLSINIAGKLFDCLESHLNK